MENAKGFSTFRIQQTKIEIFNLPMPPSENMSYPMGKYGRRFKSKELTQFQKRLTEIFLSNISSKKEGVELITRWIGQGGGLSVEFDFFFRKQRVLCKDGRSKRLDVANRLKAISDSIAEGFQFDDCEFWNISCSKNHFGTDQEEWCNVKITPLACL